MTLQEKIQLIQSLPLFTKLSLPEIRYLAKIAQEKNYRRGEIIIKQEEISADAYIILSGHVKVYRLLEDGRIVNLSILGQGEILGELSLLDGKPRSANVEAMVPVKTLVIYKNNFDQFILKYPHIVKYFLAVLTKRLRLSQISLEDIAYGKLKKRVYNVLKKLAQYYSSQEIPLSHEELAEIVGATRARVTETLDELSQEKKLILSRKKIIVL